MMPVYKKDEEIVGYLIGEKVWCLGCWDNENQKEPTQPIRKRDLRKDRYVCESCGGAIPNTYEMRLQKVLKTKGGEPDQP